MHMIMTSCRNVISVKNTANAMFIHAMFKIQMQNKFTVLNYSAFFSVPGWGNGSCFIVSEDLNIPYCLSFSISGGLISNLF